jgi:methylmalonyl-CoA/ethylmalonyl-CoA epimerase
VIKGISHIGIAVKDIESMVNTLAKALNIPVPAIKDSVENKIKVAMIELNGVGIEILEEYGETGMLADFVNKNGNGIHHLCFLTDSIESDMEELKETGFTFRQEKPILGVRGKLRAFTTDDALDGIPFELSEP